jgi:hypothetical protein
MGLLTLFFTVFMIVKQTNICSFFKTRQKSLTNFFKIEQIEVKTEPAVQIKADQIELTCIH